MKVLSSDFVTLEHQAVMTAFMREVSIARCVCSCVCMCVSNTNMCVLGSTLRACCIPMIVLPFGLLLLFDARSTTCHPNIVMFYGACTKRPNYCLLMELCEHSDVMSYFHQLRSPHCTLPRFMYSDACRIATDVARALLYLHQCCNVVHRDVKLRNVLLTAGLTAKVRIGGVRFHEVYLYRVKLSSCAIHSSLA